ncbi:hypothetical protein [Streptomyces sp. NBC_01237]|uniref:hypothetical protein n=1 Tax=Streptomyces sp. NBC_01237 TaxID=2903790 RepID=UPI002DD81023|nr:hypothetical protein [Streptomyces sp. NBC_01237]WRZ70523.1 hypothetical protein OG251_02255 [Streptomyces sp. NBC_01237]
MRGADRYRSRPASDRAARPVCLFEYDQARTAAVQFGDQVSAAVDQLATAFRQEPARLFELVLPVLAARARRRPRPTALLLQVRAEPFLPHTDLGQLLPESAQRLLAVQKT